MQFLREPWTTGASSLAQKLIQALQHHEYVLWLVCGGSSISIAAEVMRQIPESLSKGLTIMLTDERYGPVGHKDSNYTQLLDVGFEPKQAMFIPTLVEGLDLIDTAAEYGQRFTREADKADIAIAQFGIGADGHIAGILPGSLAANENAAACGYDAGTFQRLTLTFPSLKRIQIAYAFVYGAEKHDALGKLRNQDIPLAEQPSQILKSIPESYVYNDQLEEEG